MSGRDRCRTEYVDGKAISVRGRGAMTPGDREAMAEVVRAAQRHVAANPPPDVSPRVAALADRIERGDILVISRSTLKAEVAAELKRREAERGVDDGR